MLKNELESLEIEYNRLVEQIAQETKHALACTKDIIAAVFQATLKDGLFRDSHTFAMRTVVSHFNEVDGFMVSPNQYLKELEPFWGDDALPPYGMKWQMDGHFVDIYPWLQVRRGDCTNSYFFQLTPHVKESDKQKFFKWIGYDPNDDFRKSVESAKGGVEYAEQQLALAKERLAAAEKELRIHTKKGKK